MAEKRMYDAVVVGAGPNGLAAGIRLAKAGLSVLVVEGNDEIGGGTRSAELTLPGFVHDVCSAIHPMAAVSPFFRSLNLERFGLEWIHPGVPMAHPLEGGRAAVLAHSIEETANALGPDADAYRKLMSLLSEEWEALAWEILQPILHIPRSPLLMARFGVRAIQPATFLGRRRFKTEEAQALLAGMAAHALIPLESPASTAIALVLGAAAHSAGWPMPRGGSQSIARALGACFESFGGEIETGRRVRTLRDLPESRAILLNVTARQFLKIAGDGLSSRYRKRLEAFRYGPSVFKLDYAMNEPVPWTAEVCKRAGTLHIGGTMDEIADSERKAFDGKHTERPFVLAAEHSRFDSTRAPEGKHTLWAYCHVPFGSTADMTDVVERQIERFAPGFRDCILQRHTMNTADLERRNENLVGGDVNGGSATLLQLIARPVPTPTPYRTPIPGVYLCSASTPPGGGVHGMGGFNAAEAALKDLFEGGRQ